MGYNMVNSSVINEMHLQHEAALQHRIRENADAERELNYLKRKYLEKINDLIFKITFEIKNKTGFIYDESGFTCLSNYRYDDGEITFDINRVVRNKDQFIIDESPKEKEAEFYHEYKAVLDRLGRLEGKRSALIPEPNAKVVNIITINDIL